MDAFSLDVAVECYAGDKGALTPRALCIGERRVLVTEVLDQWLSPDHRYFKLVGVPPRGQIPRALRVPNEWSCESADNRSS